MFYLLLLLLALILFIAIQNIKGHHEYPAILILPYFVALFSMILYISKDTYYYNLIKDYFYLPEFLWKWLFFIAIDKSNIIRLMNVSSLSIVIISVYFSLGFNSACTTSIQKKIKYFVWIFCFFQALVYDPFINRKIYYFLYPDYITAKKYQAIERFIFSSLMESIF